MKCSDCGKQEYVIGAGRADICPDCLELRGKLVKAMMAGEITQDEMKQCQRRIANSHGSGRGASAMREILGLNAPQI